ncbi:Leucine-rich repeat [Dillenia turbinata]|uniref:Cell wall hydroxyproline-rich glycoprotein n=1 Tax=Dillenia turbinata TaxID=194707 RepID=A0AAN8ZQB4_9MAGN
MAKMKALGCFLLITLLFSSFVSTFALINVKALASFTVQSPFQSLPENGDLPKDFEDKGEVKYTFENKRLKTAYIALQAWKKAIYSDPQNFTGNWDGPDVCAYNGVFCAPALDGSHMTVVAGIDLNHGDIAGYLPVELGLLSDIALLHINSNRFCGVVPKSFSKLRLLHELDISNNRFVGPFPKSVLSIPDLKYLDIRFNDFEGELPSELFDMKLDALFLNNNRFSSSIPETLGNSTASIILFANNKFSGCIPSSIGKMSNLQEVIFLNNDLSGCLPPGLGFLGNVSVMDISETIS